MKKYILFITLSLITMNVLVKSDKDYCQAKYKNTTEARIDAKCFGHLPDSEATQKRTISVLKMQGEYDLMNLYIHAISTDNYYL